MNDNLRIMIHEVQCRIRWRRVSSAAKRGLYYLQAFIYYSKLAEIHDTAYTSTCGIEGYSGRALLGMCPNLRIRQDTGNSS